MENKTFTNDREFLESNFDEMKTMFNEIDFEEHKNALIEAEGSDEFGIPLNFMHWPNTSSQKSDVTKVYTGGSMDFNNHIHQLCPQYKGSFRIKNAVIKARFVGEKEPHSFSVGELDILHVRVYIGLADIGNGERRFRAFLVDYGNTKTIVMELEEFTMFADTSGFYYKKLMKPRAIDKDLVLFTCFNKERGLSHSTVASLKDGLCDLDTIFTDTGAEDVQAL